MIIRKPLIDAREYAVVRLHNGLKVALVHDADLTRSACCVVTATGANSPSLGRMLSEPQGFCHCARLLPRVRTVGRGGCEVSAFKQ